MSIIGGLVIHSKQKASRLIAVAYVYGIFLFFYLFMGMANASDMLELSQEQQKWLELHSVIRLGVDPDFAPYEFVSDNGQYSGIAADYLDLIAERLGVEFYVVPGLSWVEAESLGREKKLDLHPILTNTEERRKTLLFTHPYVRDPYAIITRDDGPEFSSEADLAGVRVALVRKYSATELLLKHQPQLIPVYVDTELEGLETVVSGEAAAIVGHLGSQAGLIRQNNLVNLKVSALTEFKTKGMSIAVRNDWPIFRDILDLTLESITHEEHREIRQRWIKIEGLKEAPSASVDLTAQERQWLQQHPVIKVAIDPAWAPVEFVDDQGQFEGISSDYLNRLEEMLNVRFEPATNLSWQEAVAAVKRGELAMFSAVRSTPERQTYLDFTPQYASTPIVIFGGQETPYIGDLEKLTGKKIVVVNGYAIHELLQLNHPEIKLETTANVTDALQRLLSGETDAFVGNILTTSFYLRQLGLTQIKVVGETPYRNDLHMAVRKEFAPLATILSKALQAIPAAEKDAIYRRWISVKYEYSFDYALIWRYLLVAMILFTSVLLWNLTLRRKVIERNAQFLESQERFLILFENAPEVILVLDSDSQHFVEVNKNAERLFRMNRQVLLDCNLLDLCPERQPDGSMSKKRILTSIKAALEGRSQVLECQLQRATGELVLCEIRLVLMPASGHQQVRCSIIDISARKQAEEDLQLVAGVFDNTAEGILIADNDTRIVRVNRAFTTVTGYTEQEAIGNRLLFLMSDSHDEEFFRQLHQEGFWQGEMRYRRKNGEIFPCWQNVSAVRNRDGNLIQYIGVFTDISKQKAFEGKLRRFAYYDVLTDLPNRLLFNERLENSIIRAQRTKRILALLFLDLDHFKNINDSLGHPLGDVVLKGVSLRFRQALREQDMLARLGGDEFVVLLEDLERAEDAVRVANKLVQAMENPFVIEGNELSLTTSIGISLCPGDARDATTLIKNADSAMFLAKQAGRNNYQFYTPELTLAAVERVNIGSQLRRALDQGELEVWYQSQHNLSNGEIIGAEALVRWQHPEQGLIPPDRFIPVAEEQGLISTIGKLVMASACTSMRGWLDQGLSFEKIAVNVSGQQIYTGDIVTTLNRVLEESDLPAEFLELEITESSIMEHTQHAIELMERMKTLGLTIAIDDFGTGYSSLSYLKQLPIDKLKIDQSFIMDTPGDSSDEAIIRAIIGLGQNLNLKVLAEGVETVAQQKFLLQHGCIEAQGYLLGKPMPAEEFVGFVKANRSQLGDLTLPSQNG
ncbi:MAG: transporter substrate-binding domain-containing protein [Candidatus Thiodiazotropha sp. (ex Lucinoma borealis)]|nr:transporter substrate-binding domain-containing protein [Candidatus Thiodiazotropha sp. (ex Lucinoma borealis)]